MDQKIARSVIFDVDGTLADVHHRLHHVTGSSRNWDAFFGEAEHDGLHLPIRDLACVLAQAGINIIVVSGRPEKVRCVTETWLNLHEVPHSALHMRADGDYRADYVVKSQILDAIVADGHEVLFTVDDRPGVVAMWRERGLTCLQCRDWDERSETKPGLLSLMVGPSGAGKSTWLNTDAALSFGIHSS